MNQIYWKKKQFPGSADFVVLFVFANIVHLFVVTKSDISQSRNISRELHMVLTDFTSVKPEKENSLTSSNIVNIQINTRSNKLTAGEVVDGKWH